jgi:SSS family solute:Na+ symporter
MAARATRPGLSNPELALPVLLADVLPAWVGSLGLVALFAAEISTADAVLFMLSTSLAQDLYRRFVDPAASDARLLRVSRSTAVGAGAAGVVVALFVPSVADALKAFYGVMTVALFVPVLAGLLAPRVTARDARRGIVAGILATAASLYLLAGRPSRAWLPYLLGIAVSAVTCGAGPRLRRDQE